METEGRRILKGLSPRRMGRGRESKTLLEVMTLYSLSLSPRLILWSVETRRAHSPARASKTPSKRCTVPSPPREGAMCLHERRKPCVKGFIGSLHKPGNISLFLSFTFLLSTPDHQVLVYSVQFSCSVVSDSLRPHESQHTRPPCPSPTPEVHSDSCPSSQ